MASTPPPPSPSALRVPAAPRHGAGYDQYEPYPTRYSARLASQRNSRTAAKTPPPRYPSSPSKSHSKGSPRKYRRVEEPGAVERETLSPPGSSSKPRTGTLSTEGSLHTASSRAYDLSENSHFNSTHSRFHSIVNPALPTPAKTPSKKKISGELSSSSTSRNLFPTHSNMPVKKAAPFSLESFEESGPVKKKIEIYTDSRDRIPKPSAVQTPFTATNPSASTSESAKEEPRTVVRHRKATGGPSDSKMTMMFRGAKVYKPDEDGEDVDDGDELGLFASRMDLLDGDHEILNSVQPLSRDLKPRMLFGPPVSEQPPLDEDVTDDEEQHESNALPDVESPVSTPMHSEVPQAPGANTGAARLTRSAARHGTQIEGTPTATIASESNRKRNSPFNQWLRKKQSPEELASGSTTPKKREARAVSPTGPPAIKKTRSNARHTSTT